MLARVAAEAAHRFGDRTAYVADDGWSLGYADLDRVSDEVASGLAARGVGPGDVMALVLPTAPDYPLLYLAAAKLGAVTAGVNARLAPPERAALLDLVEPRLVVTRPDHTSEGPWPEEVVESGSGVDDVLAPLRTSKPAPPAPPPDPDRPIAVVFTSGTTGTPRGAVFGERQLEFVTGVDTGWRWGEGGDGLAGTSLAHLAFLTKFPGKLVGGGTTYLMERWSAREALRLTAEHRLDRLGGIPTQLALMLRDPDVDRFDLSCVRMVVVGGAPATPSLLSEARDRFACPVLVRYSCTEAGVGTGTVPSDPPEDAEVSVGRPQPGVDVEIVPPRSPSGDRGGDHVAPERGEVCFRSPAVMSGYWGDAAATAQAFTESGAVRTGDLGFVDAQGRLVLAGRTKEMYVRGGYNVFPTVVEAVLARHPDVADVALVPRPDDVMGEVGVAVVVPRRGAGAPSLDELRAFAAAHLAHHELPEDLREVAELPLTVMEKVDRRALAGLVHTLPGPTRPPISPTDPEDPA